MLVTNIGQLLTLAGPTTPRVGPAMRELGVIDNAALLIADGSVVACGPREAIERQFEAESPDGAEVLDCGGRIVTPGLIDAHTHPVWAGNRANEFAMRCEGATYEQISAAGGGIRSTMRATRAASEAELRDRFLKFCDWFAKCGTTTIEGKSGYGLSLERELTMLRVLNSATSLRVIPTVLAAHAVPPEYEGDKPGYVDYVVEEILPQTAPLARYADIFVEANYFTADDARRIMGKARELGLGIRMHVDQLSNSGGAALAAELDADTADHLEQTDGAGIVALAGSRTMPVLLPGSVYALGKSKYPDARAMIDAGLPVVLATDFNPGSSPSPSLPMAMSLACTQMKMTPAEALTACTINAAHSLDLASEIGSLETGKVADFAVWNVDDWREIIVHFAAPTLRRTYRSGLAIAGV